MRLPPSTYQVPKPRWGWAWCTPPGYYISLPSTGRVFQVPPSEAVSDPFLAGNSRMFHSGMENTQLVRTSGTPVVQYFIKEEIYTPLPGRVERGAQGMSLTARLCPCLCKEKKPRVSELGRVPEHSENPATALAAETLPRTTSPGPQQAAPLTRHRYNRRKRQLIVLKTSEQILGRRHSQLVNIANYLQLRKNVSRRQ